MAIAVFDLDAVERLNHDFPEENTDWRGIITFRIYPYYGIELRFH
jgi:hypothetical protein